MNVLIIDTATEACSVALAGVNHIFHRFEICPQQHSQRILPMVDEVLAEAGLTLQNIDYLAFGRGPGSFTGVRIATGIIQGLALGADLPVVGISTLQAMAQQVYEQYSLQKVISATDARMNEVYIGAYAAKNGIMLPVNDEQVLAPQDANQLIINVANKDTAGAGTGWQAYAELDTGKNIQLIDSVLYPNARYMAALAKYAISSGEFSAVEDVEPVYLRDKVTWKKLPGRE
ncbi:tRNA (adenosine(37)-N6)-threonylcarbamoyltransferase complex dimerization subunit type 1 TsaB [Neptunicella marina]|uniref:tRNA threonylcarbamoyladenosine biosynthesis protein TsaB n=1 Tax=Neptunicella marina TaxID=2125989 RepID=A0A8J6IW60_9ALTE|nr:tRNA (adenosine(37)-N6)-threonylcarbamoyltransferase complex dimerization subunit type 1 TsaB [Neptunicella marina]MBC3767239.1 tRNA (adenosine(37)-N6)-threonylcarbamoyltransferase complex dimerization subunit type 1 TsaB [Neptunicella marina]